MLVALSPVCGLLQSAKHLFLVAKAAGAGGGDITTIRNTSGQPSLRH